MLRNCKMAFTAFIFLCSSQLLASPIRDYTLIKTSGGVIQLQINDLPDLKLVKRDYCLQDGVVDSCKKIEQTRPYIYFSLYGKGRCSLQARTIISIDLARTQFYNVDASSTEIIGKIISAEGQNFCGTVHLVFRNFKPTEGYKYLPLVAVKSITTGRGGFGSFDHFIRLNSLTPELPKPRDYLIIPTKYALTMKQIVGDNLSLAPNTKLQSLKIFQPTDNPIIYDGFEISSDNNK